ncbi:DUF7344 domain-containing protein [Natronomonas sp.]|uniref:DUF7344 domain-containing protein n=1 Tax=Natronomonas sp. TaxID=2184060 RepID=UPI002FC2F958
MLDSVGDDAETNGALGEGEIHDVLRNDRRRLAIKALRDRDGRASVRDLSEEVAARETGEDPPPRNKRQSVYVSLHQTHLPKLDELGILDYDGDTKTVTLDDRIDEVEVYMEVVPQYGLSWGEVYFSLGLLGLLTTVAALVGVPGISTLSLGYLVLAYFALQIAASAYHVYSQQDRIIFQRLFE